MTNPRAAARAIDALRRGWEVTVRGTDGTATFLPVETADAARLAAFDPAGAAPVLLSGRRAAALGLAGAGDCAAWAEPVLIERAGFDFDAATALADPQHDLAASDGGPYRAIALPWAAAARAALELARIAGVLPAFFVRDGGGGDTIDPSDLAAHEDAGRLMLSTRARLPVEGAEHAEIVAFRTPEGGEHVALLIGAPNGRPPLVRLHSACLTGDVLGSLKCDCGPQLRAAIRAIAASGWGILLYLRQEGRGIGLVNKLRAYALQDQGSDTVDANLRLGLPVDARDFRIAARMLALLGQPSIRLMTNNPAKVAAIAASGIAVERVAHQLPSNPHNHVYLATKRDRIGHQL